MRTMMAEFSIGQHPWRPESEDAHVVQQRCICGKFEQANYGRGRAKGTS